MAVEKIILDIQAKVGKAKKDINSLKTGTKNLNKEVDKTSALLKKAGTAMLAFASIGLITRAIRDMITLNVEFEKTLTNVLTLLDKTTKAKFGDFLSAGALRTMRNFGLEVSDVNKALFDTISAGIKAGDSIKFLSEAAKLAVGGVTDLSTAVDGMTSIMNAYGLSIDDANKVASAFFTAQKHGKTTVSELAQNVGMLAPTMKMAGIGFQEMLTGMALLTKQGISTDMATTALRATIIALTKTTPATEKVFKSLGIETGIVAIKTNGFMETLMQVAKAAQENEDILTQVIPSVRALTAVAALGEEALILYNVILEDVTTNYGEGSDAAEAYTLQMDTMAKQIDITKGAWKEWRIELGKQAKGTEEAQKIRTFFWVLRLLMISSSEAMREVEEAGMGIGEMLSKLGPQFEGFAWEVDKAKTKVEEFSELDEQKRLKKEDKAFRERMKILKAEGDLKLKGLEEDEEMVDESFENSMAQAEKERDVRDEFRKEVNEKILDGLNKMLDEELKILQKKTDAEKQTANVSIEIEQYKADNKLNIVRGAFGTAQELAGKHFFIQKILAIAESVVSTFLSAQLAFASMVGIPVVGPTLAKRARRRAIISGLANTALIIGTTIAGFEEGGFTGKSKFNARDRDGRIAGFVHEDEFVFNREKTRTLRPLFEDIQHNRIDIHGLAALTRRGMMQTMPKLNADILENEVKKIYRKMSEGNPEKPTFVYYDHGYTKKIGNITINVSN